MATAEQYADWIVKNQDKKGSPEFETVAQAYKVAREQPAQAAEPQKPELMTRMQNLAAGGVRGAGSIGATLMAPQDMLEDALTRALGGKTPTSRNDQRRQDMTGALQTMGADPTSGAFQVGKIGGEIAGTLGVGPAVAGAAGAVPQIASRAGPVLDAIGTAGMRAGGLQGARGMATRMAGGAITGGASAGLVDPTQAGMGAAVGAALPPALKAAGAVGGAAGRALRGPEQTPDLAAAITQARQAGYVIPPSQARPTMGNRMLEGLSGKITTAQNASVRNQSVTDRLAAEALGLPGDTKLTADVLTTVRRQAGQAYDALGSAGVITPGQSYTQALDSIAQPFKTAAAGFPGAKPSPVLELVDSLKSPQFDASSAVAKIKELRSAADDAFRAGNSDMGRASRSAAKALEDAIEDHLTKTGATGALQQFRDARQLIAKTYTVEKALNPTTGTVDARKIGAQITKGKPVSGQLAQAGDFANRFPKAAQPTEGMGSLPQTSPLDWIPAGAATMGTGNPLMMLGVGARPLARSALLSGAVQNRLVQPQANALLQLLEPDALQLGYRAAPAGLATSR
jgi:hypothetical protein